MVLTLNKLIIKIHECDSEIKCGALSTNYKEVERTVKITILPVLNQQVPLWSI